MPTPFPRPAAPGTVPVNRLDEVQTLHAACLRWAEPARIHRPYADLTFAFGFAILGDATRARRLLADAWAVLQSPTPPPVEQNRDYDPATAALVPRIAYRMFAYRVEQALAGRLLSGPLAGDAAVVLEELEREAGPINNPQKHARYVCTRLQEQSRILDPDGRIDPYALWTRPGSPSAPARGSSTDTGPARTRGREAPEDGTGPEQRQLLALRHGLRMTPAEGTLTPPELIGLARSILAEATGHVAERGQEFVVSLQCDALGRALHVAAAIGRADLCLKLADLFADLAERFPTDSRVRLINTAGGECLRCLRVFGLRDSFDALLSRIGRLRGAEPGTYPDATSPEAMAARVQARLFLAAGRRALGTDAEAVPLLDEGRNWLLGPDGKMLLPLPYMALARTYLAALGEGTAADLTRVAELFGGMPADASVDHYATAPYFSRLALPLTEEGVSAACRMLLELPLR